MIHFEANMAIDLSHFLNAESEGWDDDRQQTEWVVYFLGVEVGRVFGNYETGDEVVRLGGFHTKAEGLIKRLWESA